MHILERVLEGRQPHGGLLIGRLELKAPDGGAHVQESNDGAVTTVTFEEKNGKTLLVVHEIYPSKEALEVNGGMENAMPETFSQLDELLAELGARR